MIAVQMLVLLALLVELVRTWRSVGDLKRRVSSLESELDAIRLQTRQGLAAGIPPAEQDPSAAAPTADGQTATPSTPHARDVPVPLPTAAAGAGEAATEPLPPPLPADAARQAPLRIPRADTEGPRSPGVIGLVIGKVRDWFTQGNVPVKIGVLVLLAGVAALLRYASDQGWLTLPIELRLAGISLAAMAGLGFGWHKRHAKPGFALAVQGGAIGVLLLTVFAAARMYGVLPQSLAFVLSVALIAGLGVLAVLQDSRSLAVFGVLAGFLAPIWLSDGSGNHVALFGYYTILNIAIVALAWARRWWLLNLLGFVFTWGVGIAWGVLRYEPHLLQTTQPFLLVFFLIYFLIPIINARRHAARLNNWMDLVLLFGTPLAAFAVQASLWSGQPMVLAYSALVLALLYAASGWWLRGREHTLAIAQVHAMLAVGFATILVPLAFPGDPMIVVYALEAAAIVWHCARRGWWLGITVGLLILVAAMLKHLQLHLLGLQDETAMWAILNAGFLTGLVVAAAAGISAGGLHARYPVLARLVYLVGLGYWMLVSIHEASTLPWEDRAGDLLMVLAAATGYAAVRAWSRYRDGVLGLTGLLGVLAGYVGLLVQSVERGQPLADAGWLAWPVFGVITWFTLQRMRPLHAVWPRLALLAWWPLWAALFAAACLQWLDHGWLGEGWIAAGTAWPWLLLAMLVIRHWQVIRRPVGDVADPMRLGVQLGVLAIMGWGWVFSLMMAGSATPLPWIPVLNPLELCQLAALLLLWDWLRHAPADVLPRSMRGLLPGLAGLAWITSIVLHAVHHWGGVPWDAGLLGSSLAQTSLTVTWSVLGVAGWIIGSRHGHRGLWLAAALLMAVVLAKLVLVDRQHLGNLLGIGSFIAYGLLCTVVGYVAPAPPRAAQAPNPSETAA